VLFVPGSSIHTFFMAFPIDVLYMSKDHRVVGMDGQLQPWSFGRWYKGTRYVLELPAGALQRSGTQIGDKVEFRDQERPATGH
jgi:uncharacterized membrane protein (UPF0127 family)